MSTTTTFTATDVSQQRLATAKDVPDDATVAEVIENLLSQLDMPRNDADGQALTYRARNEREGRFLQTHERVGDAVRSGDRLMLQPNIDAGRAPRCGARA
jgi:hypothetical protein